MLTIRHIDVIKFHGRLGNFASDRYAKKAFEMLADDADSGVTNWISNARSLISLYDINDGDNKLKIKIKIKEKFSSSILEKLRYHVSNEKTLRTFRLFENAFKFETYRDVMCDFKTRGNFSKLRLSSHKLQIETRRYGKHPVPKEDRYCIFARQTL